MFYPYVVREKGCYDKAQVQINQINLNVPSKGWIISQVCESRWDTLMALEECLQQATDSAKINFNVNEIISRAVFVIRPFTKSLSRLKVEHNEECNDFIRFQVE